MEFENIAEQTRTPNFEQSETKYEKTEDKENSIETHVQ